MADIEGETGIRLGSFGLLGAYKGFSSEAMSIMTMLENTTNIPMTWPYDVVGLEGS